VESILEAAALERSGPRGRRKASPRTALVKETSELIMAIVERQRVLADAAALHGLTELQIRVLRYLCRSGLTPIGVLAGYLANDPSTLTTFVDRLEQREYVEGRNDPDDRRVKRIALTESGERIGETSGTM
jgi:DNA-binding MarR family transcriptional regulator